MPIQRQVPLVKKDQGDQVHTAAEFSVSYTQYLNAQSDIVGELPSWAQDLEVLEKFYRMMTLTRLFDKKAVALQRTGQMGTYPSCLGQEAIATGLGYAMQATDVLAPYYRDQATQLIRGVKMEEILLYWGGDERGSLYTEGPSQDLPICVPIATQITHGAGVATAMKIRHEKRVAVTTCGDGATSRGDFYEPLNLAGAWQLPMVILVNNNQWAISVPLEIQTASETIAQKAIAAGIPGEQVDGNDVIAVYERCHQAIERARSGKGPTLIEAITYRLCDHTTADDATRYRPPDGLSEAWKIEPIKRLQTYLHKQGHWNEAKEQDLISDCEKQINQAVDNYLSTPPQAEQDLFDYLFEETPNAMLEQRQHMLDKIAVERIAK